MTPAPTLKTTTELRSGLLSAVEAMLQRAESHDPTPALNEAGRLALRHAQPGVTHLTLLVADEVRGYAQLTESAAASTGQVVVDPAARRTGHGSGLVAELRHRAKHPLRVWAYGNTEAAQALARRTGLVEIRSLLIMTRRLTDLPDPRPPDGIRIDTFVPGRDEQAWLAVNRRAFAAHPEQGSLTAQDLAARLAEPWFDPDGFFLARSCAEQHRLLGFHWTKQHPGGLGEVYVLGVDPDAQGRGLASALLLRGLHHLSERGDPTVELYVESDSARAVRLYTRHGFEVASRDVMYGVAGPE